MEPHGISVRGWTSVGLSEYTSVYRNIIEPHGTSWNLMEPHGISQNPEEPHGISWKVLEHSGIFWLLTNDYK
jgi:hypothetical protein